MQNLPRTKNLFNDFTNSNALHLLRKKDSIKSRKAYGFSFGFGFNFIVVCLFVSLWFYHLELNELKINAQYMVKAQHSKD